MLRKFIDYKRFRTLRHLYVLVNLGIIFYSFFASLSNWCMDNKTLQWKIPILNNRNNIYLQRFSCTYLVCIENIYSQNGNCILINVWAFMMVTTTNIAFLDNGMPKVKIEIEIGTLECGHVSFIWSDIFNLLYVWT